MPITWNPWHGCRKISPGCRNCYVYRTDAKYEKDSSKVKRNKDFDLPVRKNRKGEYKVSPGEMIYTCFTSDFFLEDADEWRGSAWEIIKERRDCTFLFITKRILRFDEVIPKDWGDGYDNVVIGCTAENQAMADLRLPVFVKAPIKKRLIICSPLLEEISLEPWLGYADEVTAAGESGDGAGVCDYDWVLSLRQQCLDKRVDFHFQQTGANFRKDGRVYNIERKYQHRQADKAGIDLRF